MTHTRMVLALAALVGVAGCTDLAEHPVTGVDSRYFQTPAGAEAATLGTYAALRNFYGGEGETRMWQAGTDSWEKGDQLDANGVGYFNDYTPQLAASVGGTIQDFWSASYSAINTANTAIAAISGSTDLSDAVKNTRVAENRFLRALFYFNLVRSYGPVQLNLEPTQGVSIQAHRTPVDSIYSAAIIPDLQFAIANLPLKGATSDYFRATKGAAQTLLAEVYLTRGASGDYANAIQLTSDVITSGKYTLNSKFKSLFCLPTTSSGACDYAPSQKTDPELIFSVTFTGDNAQDQFGNNLHLYWVMAYDLVGATPGSPSLARTPGYGRPYRRLRPTMHMLNLFKATDSRYDGTFQSVWYQPASAGGDTAIFFTRAASEPSSTGAWKGKRFGMQQYTNQLFPTLLKWLDQTRADAGVFPGHRDRQLWRLADVYLLRAEAYIKSGQPSLAVADINKIRERAAVDQANPASNDLVQAEFDASPIDYLLDERERELAGEEQRFFVLTRQGADVFLRRIKNNNSTANQAMDAHFMLRPIPQTQIDRTEGGATAFPQNPGY